MGGFGVSQMELPGRLFRSRIRAVFQRWTTVEGLLIVISAPSGVGKTTLIRRLLREEPSCTFAVSHTTRPPRPGEKDGVDYYFVSESDFDRMIGASEFLEWAVVHSHRYGTSRAEVERLRAQGRDVVFEVDYQGGRALMRHFPESVSIFVLPPSMAEVRRRLAERGTDSPDEVALRLRNARVEIATAFEYRYAVVNDEVGRALGDIRTILAAERLASARAKTLIRALVSEDV